MKPNKNRRRIDILKILFRNPKYIIQGFLSYIFMNGHIGELPTKYTYRLFKDKQCKIELECLSTISGGVSITELATISFIVRYLEPKTIFEIGTLDGRTTLNLAINSIEDCQIYTFDLPLEERKNYYLKRLEEIKVWPMDEPPPFLSTVGGCFQNHSKASKIKQLYGNTKTFDFSHFYNKIDFIFIDANHEYEYVKADSQIAMKMLSDKGIIIWHDYPNVMGVTAYLDEISKEGMPIYHLWDTRLALYKRQGF